MVNIINGREISETIRKEVAEKTKELVDGGKIQPGLAVIIVGEDKASQVYVNSMLRACDKAGFKSMEVKLPKDIYQKDLLDKIRELNTDKSIHGILIQLPLPKHIDELMVLRFIDMDKDVDCFNPTNFGFLNLGTDCLAPCTPAGVMDLLSRSNLEIEGKRAVVVGRSNIVGKPMAALLMKENATVTVAHSRTENLDDLCREADILVAAIGRPEFIKGDWVKEGAVVIDVGTNSVDDASSPRGYRLVGDVEFEEAKKRASYITPVPGGVGPMTIAVLLQNTLKAYNKLTK